jgi:phosphoserine phosphatase
LAVVIHLPAWIMNLPRIEISVDDQTLTYIGPADTRMTWPVSTAAKGVGSEDHSFRTPIGRFEVVERIGENAISESVFRARRLVDRWDGQPCAEDLILARILRLRGLEAHNRNTESRFIYIHGTNHESLLGKPSSHGCIRMARRDVVELFDLVPVGCEVIIHPPRRHREPLIFFDCDSTLSAMEGIDELATEAGPEVFKQVKELTDAAMNGEIPLGEVFKARMARIAPTRELCSRVSARYLETMTPGSRELVRQFQDAGWSMAILSGGFEPIIRPLADELGIAHVEAVPLYFHEDGSYAGYGDDHPATRNGGKPEIIRTWQEALHPEYTVMVGDGISDLETASVCDLFIGYGGVVARNQVRTQADLWIEDFAQIDPVGVIQTIQSQK